MHVEATGALTLHRLTLTGGFTSSGGGIRNEGGHVMIMDSTIMNHRTLPGGGAGLWNSGTVRILRSTLTGNIAMPGGSGTAIYNEGTLRLINSTLTDNLSDEAGGLYNSGGLSMITNSTVAHNHGGQPGGGVGGLLNIEGGTLILVNSTIVANEGEAGAHSGGLVNYSGTVFLQNTILARNSEGRPGPSEPDCFGPITSFGTNLVGDPTGCTITLEPTDLTGDPGLGDFTDDGTPGNGHFPLLPTSPAINAGNDAVCPRRDQLGTRRVGPCDIGAIEFRDQDDDQDDRRHGEDSVATAQEPQ